MKGHAGSLPHDKSIRTRLTPEIVLAAKGIHSEDFFEDECINIDSYKLMYRIWGNHQKLMFQNKNMGYLEIEKKTKAAEVEFNICKVIVNYHNLIQTIRAKLICLNDELNTPVSYEYSSRITDNALCTRPDLSLDRYGRFEKGYIIETIKGKDYRRVFSNPLVFDFTVYDLVIKGKIAGPFTYYENLYAFKPDNKLIKIPVLSTLGKHNLNCMIQFGTGLTERIFYKTNSNLPVMMVQNSAAYILDYNAVDATEQLKEELNTGGVHYEY